MFSKKSLANFFLKVVFFGIIFFSYTNIVSAATITVDSNLDSQTTDGNCTLREAIANAEGDFDTTTGDCVAGSGTDTIVFSEPMIISSSSVFNINSPIHLDATANGVGTCNNKDLGVVLDGAGFNMSSAVGATIRGLVIKNYSGSGVYISSATNNTISCNIIGLDETGSIADGGGIGITVSASSGVIIGGSNAGDGNIISGNTQRGIAIFSGSDISVKGNIIGLDVSGTTAIGTQESGIVIVDGESITIGGTTEPERNIISGNQAEFYAEGILITGSTVGSSNITIQGNYIGTDITGTVDLENSAESINICTASCNPADIFSSNIIIGGSGVGEGNVLTQAIVGDLTSDITIQGNYIGVLADGVTPTTEPSSHGIEFVDSETIYVGGANAGEGNIIGGSIAQGISFDGITNSFIKGNNIGVGADGETAVSNGAHGISISDSSNLTIGGSTENERNVISGNGAKGISLQDSIGIVIKGNYVGLDATGLVASANDAGIDVNGGSDITIGGSTAGERNVISGNTATSLNFDDVTGVTITGNYFGVDITGLVGIPNNVGIVVNGGSDITIGGSTEGERNIIAGNESTGIAIFNPASDVTVINTYVGVGSDGETIIPNLEYGIYISGSDNITIGGSTAGERNIISGNTAGITAANDPAEIIIKGNYIGVLADGVTEAPNDEGGIIFITGSGTIGGTTPEEGNIIANQAPNILLAGGTLTVQNNEITGGLGIAEIFSGTVSILQNSIYNNVIGFNIAIDGDALGTRTVNDAGDADSGPNDFLNYPEFTGATDAGAGVINLTYELDVPAGYYRVEFFTNPTALPAEFAFGVGETYVDYDIFVSTGSSKTQTKAITATITDGITATATKCTDATCTAYEETSEFSDELEAFIQAARSSGGGGGGKVYGCKDPLALNYRKFVAHNQTLCIYPVVATPTPSLGEQGLCPAEQQLTQNLRAPSRNGVYDNYTKAIVTQAKILQAHLNRLGFNSGPVDGILGPISGGAIKRLQTYLGTIPDGYVGPITRGLLNNSCESKTL